MTKNNYLSILAVKQFVEWLSANLDNATLGHSYINRRTGNWSCGSLYDAYRQYHWPHPALPHLSLPKGSSFATSASTLAALRHTLQVSLARPSNDAATCSAAIDVMIWGGVRAGNVRWLNVNQSGLSNVLLDIRDALNANDTTNTRLGEPTLRFNAGMTKVYSLICESLIIYDSRVAAALGWAVTLFCHAKGLPNVPQELSFPWAAAKTAPSHPSPKRRNPSVGALTFPNLRAGTEHAKWNLKASWILGAVLASPNAQASQFKQSVPANDQLRAVEAALFMIGYDLNSTPTGTPVTSAPAQTVTAGSRYSCYTLAKSVPFQYWITANGIETDDDKTFLVHDINAMLNILWNHFGHTAFPLANSATKVRNGTASTGVGSAYFQATGKNPPNTSRLVAVLEDLAILSRFVPAPKKGLHWTINANLLNLNCRKDRIDIRPVL